jgi:hypothetical protein
MKSEDFFWSDPHNRLEPGAWAVPSVKQDPSIGLPQQLEGYVSTGYLQTIELVSCSKKYGLSLWQVLTL